MKAIENDLGLWALRFLLASLAISPLRWLGLNLLRFRRALGLLAFGYAALHLTAWIGLDLGLRLSQAVEDMVKRPYVLVGMLGFAAMLPLALTSTKASIRRMEPRAGTVCTGLPMPPSCWARCISPFFPGCGPPSCLPIWRWPSSFLGPG